MAVFPYPPWIAATAVGSAPPVPRPMAVTELLDQGFRILRSQYRIIGPIVAGIATPLAVLSAVASRQALSGQTGVEIFTGGLFGAAAAQGNWVVALYAVALLWPALVAGPVCRVTATTWFGHVDTRGAALRSGMRRVPAQLLVVVAVDVMVLVGAVLFIVPGIAMWVLFRLALPALVVERMGPFRAIARSAKLARARFWPLLGVCTLAFVVSQAVTQLLSLGPTAIAAIFGLHWAFLVVAAGAIVVQSVTWTWSMIVVTLIYLDVRARREGLDLVVRAGSQSP